MNKVSGSDDLVLTYAYGEAVAQSGGLWNLSGPSTAEISKNLSVTDNSGTEQLSFDAASGALSVANSGSFPLVKTDYLSDLANGQIEIMSPLLGNSGGTLEVLGGIKLGDDPATCDATALGRMRHNSLSARYEYCSGAAWTPVGDDLGSHAAMENISLGSNYLSGDGDNEGLRIGVDGNVSVISEDVGEDVVAAFIGKSQNTYLRVSNQGGTGQSAGIVASDTTTSSYLRYNFLDQEWQVYAAGGGQVSDIRMVVEDGGNVGIGVIAPASRLQVNGGVMIGNDNDACSGSKSGTIRYTSSDPDWEYCDGSSWVSFTVGDSDTLADLSCAAGEVAEWNGSVWACAESGSGTCPTGFTQVGSLGCMQNDEQGSDTWREASNDCFSSYQGRLPTHEEWGIAVSNYALANVLDGVEWNSGVQAFDGTIPRAFYYASRLTTTDQLWPLSRADNQIVDYRCFIPN